MDNMQKHIEKVIKEAMKTTRFKMDIMLLEQLISLINNGIIEVMEQPLKSNFNPENSKLTIESCLGVRFKGKEKIIEQEKQIQSLQAENKKLRECVEFYADKNNWFDFAKCSSYTAIERYDWETLADFCDETVLGGKLARQTIKEIDNDTE